MSLIRDIGVRQAKRRLVPSSCIACPAEEGRPMSVADVVSLMYQYVDNMAFLLLAALGLIIILGVVNVINLAHGELIMLGAYITTLAYNRANLPLPICMMLSVSALAYSGWRWNGSLSGVSTVTDSARLSPLGV